MTPERRTELTRLAALPPESPDLGQALRDRLHLIAAVQELLSELEHVEAVARLSKHLKPNWRRSR